MLAERPDDAERAAREALRVNPRFDLSRIEGLMGPGDPEALTRFAEALRAAGIPDAHG